MPGCAPWSDNPLGRTVICNSANRPTGSQRYPGLEIYETDTFTKWRWDGSAWVGVPMGRIAYASKTTQQTGITSVADITGLSVTFTAVAGRRYRVKLQALVFSSISNDIVQIQIRDGSGTVLNLSQVLAASSTFGLSAACEYVTNGWTGSTTVKAAALRNSGTGTVTFDAGATYPAFLLVEDIGS